MLLNAFSPTLRLKEGSPEVVTHIQHLMKKICDAFKDSLNTSHLKSQDPGMTGQLNKLDVI